MKKGTFRMLEWSNVTFPVIFPLFIQFHEFININIAELPELPGASGLIGALGSEMNIGILISCILVVIILLVQVYQNYDKRLSSYKNNHK